MIYQEHVFQNVPFIFHVAIHTIGMMDVEGVYLVFFKHYPLTNIEL